MKPSLPIKLDAPWKEATAKYRWPVTTMALPVEYNMLLIAQMAEKNIRFVLKRKKYSYVISPEKAKEVVRAHNSVFTRKHDKKIIAVIPSSECEVEHVS